MNVRRRTGAGSKAVERQQQSDYDSDDEGTTELAFGEKRRGLGALMSTVMLGDGGAEGAESRPLLGRSQSSTRVRVRVGLVEQSERNRRGRVRVGCL